MAQCLQASSYFSLRNEKLISRQSSTLTSFNLGVDFALESYTYFLVYFESKLSSSIFFRQSTPQALLIADSIASVSNVVCDDLDLDPLEMGGIVTWTPPADLSLVQQYRSLEYIALREGMTFSNLFKVYSA